MNTELTHEQACQLRMIPVFMPDYLDEKIRETLRWAHDTDVPLIELGWRFDESSVWQLSKAGLEALDAYNAKWVPIRREVAEEAHEQLWWHIGYYSDVVVGLRKDLEAQ